MATATTALPTQPQSTKTQHWAPFWSIACDQNMLSPGNDNNNSAKLLCSQSSTQVTTRKKEERADITVMRLAAQATSIKQ